MRIGVMGGTFDPIHLGHLRAAEEIYLAFGLDRIIFVPAARPPHKDAGDVAAPIHRYEMVSLATIFTPYFTVSPIELNRPGTSYRELLHLAQVIVTARPGWRLDEVETALAPEQRAALGHPTFKYLRISEVGLQLARTPPVPGLVLLVEVVSLDISSREIRQLVEEGRSVRFLVPDTVAAYVQKNRLYQRRAGRRKEDNPHRG
ncbi:MAG: nicotinate-nicotinamide nucleotide adenylyltransferase [candidate division NC10 bacterium]|nr:nicotinate-nicotinamide nucleotide adenylyltransferase [candidate division NC10 bacterium]